MKYTENIALVPEAVSYIEEFVECLTQEDLKEFQCLCPSDSLKVALRDYLKNVHEHPDRYRLRALFENTSGVPLLIGGWDCFTGTAWFLTTDNAQDYPVQVIRGIKECKQEALEETPTLVNTMMRTNRNHVALLESIGAQFVGPIESIGGEPFQAFIISK